MKGHVKKLDLLFDRVMESHVKMVGKKSEEEEDFLQYLLRVKDDDEKAPLSMTHVKSLLMDMVLGGVDTSVNASEFAMAEIVSRPEVLNKIRLELDQVVGKDNIVEESHLPKLPYLQAVMKETLRLHPTLPLLVPHRNSETSVVAGYTVPKDSKIFINVWRFIEILRIGMNQTSSNLRGFWRIRLISMEVILSTCLLGQEGGFVRRLTWLRDLFCSTLLHFFTLLIGKHLKDRSLRLKRSLVLFLS
uniref:AT4g22710/T12H17_100 n=1 Tax=Arabidopsis thaliana TaxID=3702 RepID=Q94JS3_ARATH|nr:AT4g22710/T12H17_100 [Arabidopsis thaliana]AAN18097.1 At4g22710/T12H17_100 [Arabidopsis thaliana]